MRVASGQASNYSHHSSGRRRGSQPSASPPPTFVTANGIANTSSGASIVVPAPASIVSGNVLLMFIANDGVNVDPASTGWTLLGRNPNSDSVAVLYKTAGGSEPGTYTVTVSNGWLAGQILQYSNATTTGLTVGLNTSTTPNMTAPSVTPSTSGVLWITGYTNSSPTNLVSGPSGHTQRGAQFSGTGGAVWVYEHSTTSGSPTGTATATCTGSGAVASGVSVLLTHH